MSMIDLDSPNKYKLDIQKEYGLQKNEIYFVSFYHQGKLHTRPIEIIGRSWAVYNHNYSECIREETDWKYIFKSKTLTNSTEEREIKYIDDTGYGFDSMRVSLIGRTEDEAKIRFILFNLEAPYLKEWEKVFFKSELEAFRQLKPTLVKYVEGFKLYGGTGGILNLDEYFINNNKDVLNNIFFKENKEL